MCRQQCERLLHGNDRLKGQSSTRSESLASLIRVERVVGTEGWFARGHAGRCQSTGAAACAGGLDACRRAAAAQSQPCCRCRGASCYVASVCRAWARRRARSAASAPIPVLVVAVPEPPLLRGLHAAQALRRARLSDILPVFRGRAEGLVVAPSRPPRGVPSFLMSRRCYQIALPCVFARTIGERPEVVSPRLASSGGPLCGSHSPQIQDSSQTRSRSVCRPMRTVQQATELCVSARKTPFVMTGQSQCARPRRDLAVGCSPHWHEIGLAWFL